MIFSAMVQTLWISLLVQAFFFVFAAKLKTDKVTDLSYSLTFVILAGVLLLQNDYRQLPQLFLAFMVVVWGLRLAAYLLVRIFIMGRDRRFDGIRERFWKFFSFWLFQGLVVWMIMLPVTVWFARPGPQNNWMTVGFLMWIAGLSLESVADVQKFRQKLSPSGGSRWMSTGLWRYSRHPNYFGELLCWWGLFVFGAGDLSGSAWLVLLGPITLTYLLLFVTGIPTLERSAAAKWGDDARYRAYLESTPALIPWPVRNRGSKVPQRKSSKQV